MQKKVRYRLAIFASGGGSNAKCIIDYFKYHNNIEVVVLVSNRSAAGVLDIAKSHNLPTEIISQSELKEQDHVMSLLTGHEIDFIILAGFLLLIPPYLVAKYPNRIINIHPSLLPKYGGKGMYGHHVHEAVKIAGDNISGCTIHIVNEKFDEGRILLQVSCQISPLDTAIQIAAKVLKLEHTHFAKTLDDYIMSL